VIVLPTIAPQIAPPLPPPLSVMSACGQYSVKYALPLPFSVTDWPEPPVHMISTFVGLSESLLSAPLPLSVMSPDTYITTAPLGFAVWKSIDELPLSLIDVAEKSPGPVTIVLPLIAPSWFDAAIAGAVGIGSEMFAPAVHEPEVCGALEKLLALVPISAEHALASTQVVGSLHAVAEL